MWGDSCTPGRAGPIALISQSGNVAVNALGSTRALRLHTVVSCGNQAVLDAADYLAAVADLEDVRAVALYLEAEGSGAKLAEALARCADQGIGVTVLKAGSSARGAAAATAHTGSIAGDARVFRALVEEAGGAWARNPHELLELAKALAYGRRTPAAGVAILTCSGGDAAIGADEAARLGVPLPDFSPRTAAALAEALPPTAAAANPLDYTAVIFGEAERTAMLVRLAGADAAIGPVLVYYDRPADLGSDAAMSWDSALEASCAAPPRSTSPFWSPRPSPS
jgi:acetyl-CoA synthetase